MQMIPADIWEQFSAVLEKQAVPVSCYADYRQWLRYYLDFCSKYPLPDSQSEHARMFIQKLREQKQTPEQQKQAAHPYEGGGRRLREVFLASLPFMWGYLPYLLLYWRVCT